MKKILFIMILATTFIPVTPIGASNRGMNDTYKVKNIDSQISHNATSELQDISNIEDQLVQKKIQVENRIDRTKEIKEMANRKSVASKKRDRLFGILLLAYGGKR